MHKKLVIDGIIMGIVAGVLSILYRFALEKIEHIRALLFAGRDYTEIVVTVLVILTMAGIVYLLLKFEPLSSGSGIPQVQAENQGYVNMNPLKVLFSKFFGGVAGSLGGLSLGREGPSIQIGAAVGKLFSKLLKREEEDKAYMISAGASAGLAAAFNAPLAGTLFTLEEMHKKFMPTLLVPSLIASVIADFISKNVFGIYPAFRFTVSSQLDLMQYWHLVILAVFTGLLGVMFNKMLVGTLKIYDVIKLPQFIKIVIPFVTMGITGYFAYILLGGGHHLISSLEEHPVSLAVMIGIFIAKLLLTCLCYGSGAQGGIFLPVLVLGGLIGSIYYTIMGISGFMSTDFYSNFIILGMVGYLTAVIRSPILSIILVTEMTGNFTYLLPIALVSIISYVVADISKVPAIYETLLERTIEQQKEKQCLHR